MYPRYHILLGAVFSFLLFLIFPHIDLLAAAIIFLSSVLIDVDHYLYYVYKRKDINFKDSLSFYSKFEKKFNSLSKQQKKKYYTGLCFLHGIESLIILAILSYFSLFFLWIFIGFVFHHLLDLIEMSRREVEPHKVISFIYSCITAKNKKLIQDT